MKENPETCDNIETMIIDGYRNISMDMYNFSGKTNQGTFLNGANWTYLSMCIVLFPLTFPLAQHVTTKF